MAQSGIFLNQVGYSGLIKVISGLIELDDVRLDLFEKIIICSLNILVKLEQHFSTE